MPKKKLEKLVKKKVSLEWHQMNIIKAAEQYSKAAWMLENALGSLRVAEREYKLKHK